MSNKNIIEYLCCANLHIDMIKCAQYIEMKCEFVECGVIRGSRCHPGDIPPTHPSLPLDNGSVWRAHFAVRELIAPPITHNNFKVRCIVISPGRYQSCCVQELTGTPRKGGLLLLLLLLLVCRAVTSSQRLLHKMANSRAVLIARIHTSQERSVAKKLNTYPR